VSTVSERQRLDLYERLGATLGKEHAEVLMEYLPPVGWNDVARRHDLDLVRAEMHTLGSELRTEMAEVRVEMNGLRVELHEQLSRQLIWLVGTILASVGAILGVIASVS
jgi:hypothetical protein